MAFTPHRRLPRRPLPVVSTPRNLSRRSLLRRSVIAAGVFAASTTRPLDARQGIFMPIRIEIPAIEVAAEIEQIHVIDGVMGTPGDPWNVGWYSQLGFPGQDRNVVMAGHRDYWDVGPVVFWELGALEVGDRILLDDRNGDHLAYQVTEVAQMSAGTPPTEYTSGSGEQLTLITCSGDFDGASYDARLIVRAVQV